MPDCFILCTANAVHVLYVVNTEYIPHSMTINNAKIYYNIESQGRHKIRNKQRKILDKYMNLGNL